MNIVLYTRRNAVQFGGNWRVALREMGEGCILGPLELSAWREDAKAGFHFAHDGGTATGSVHFDPQEVVPPPSEVCERIQLDAVWFFATDFSWALHTEHEDLDTATLFKKSAEASLFLSPMTSPRCATATSAAQLGVERRRNPRCARAFAG
jgi:hypothetical protein